MNAFKFRHRSWFAKESLDLLRRYSVALCVHDMPEAECPVLATAPYPYFRMHGEGTVVEGDYSDKKLRQWAERMRSLGEGVDRVFVYFDNDEEARALANAQTLRDMLPKRLGAGD